LLLSALWTRNAAIRASAAVNRKNVSRRLTVAYF
jgi:hypothetical protein